MGPREASGYPDRVIALGGAGVNDQRRLPADCLLDLVSDLFLVRAGEPG